MNIVNNQPELKVGDVVNWHPESEAKIITECKGFTRSNRGPFEITYIDCDPGSLVPYRVKISTLDGEPVTRLMETGNTGYHDLWAAMFFVPNPFLTKVHKALNRKRKHATLGLPIR